jgi:hypothetical protein
MERSLDTMNELATLEPDDDEDEESSESDEDEEGTDVEAGKGKEVPSAREPVAVKKVIAKQVYTEAVIAEADKAWTELEEATQSDILGAEGERRRLAMAKYYRSLRKRWDSVSYVSRPNVAGFDDALYDLIKNMNSKLKEPILTPGYVTELEGYWKEFDVGLLEVRTLNTSLTV